MATFTTPFRVFDTVLSCGVCGAASSSNCLRCDMPRCGGHRLGETERCTPCEDAFQPMTHAALVVAIPSAVLIYGAVWVALTVAAMGSVDLAAAVVGLSLVIGTFGMYWAATLRLRARKQFLAERNSKQA